MLSDKYSTKMLKLIEASQALAEVGQEAKEILKLAIAPSKEFLERVRKM